MTSQEILHLIDTKPLQRVDYQIFLDKENPLHYLPISIINGKEKGKIFTIVAGIHGYEYPPIMAVQQLLCEIKPENINGTLIIIPIANVAAFHQRVPNLHPTDRKNINRIFPGKEDGTISEKIANYITKNIIPISDVFLDIHGGDANEDLVPFVCYYNNNEDKEKTQVAAKLSQVSTMPYVVSYPYNITKTEPALYAFKQAVQNGIVGLSLEAGRLGTNDPSDVKLITDSVYNMLNLLEIHPSQTTDNQVETKFFSKQTYIKAEISGIFYSKYFAGDFINKGEKLGYITDEFGKLLENIISPTDGMILYKIGTPPANIDETMFCIVE